MNFSFFRLMNKKSKFSTDLEILKQEVEITFYKSSGPGGQRKNKKETAVRIFHPPSGITVIATEHRSQAKNKELAFERLQAKLKKVNKKKKQRKPTKMPHRIKEQILKKKKEQSEKKKMRTKVHLTTEDTE